MLTATSLYIFIEGFPWDLNVIILTFFVLANYGFTATKEYIIFFRISLIFWTYKKKKRKGKKYSSLEDAQRIHLHFPSELTGFSIFVFLDFFFSMVTGVSDRQALLFQVLRPPEAFRVGQRVDSGVQVQQEEGKGRVQLHRLRLQRRPRNRWVRPWNSRPILSGADVFIMW